MFTGTSPWYKRLNSLRNLLNLLTTQQGISPNFFPIRDCRRCFGFKNLLNRQKNNELLEKESYQNEQLLTSYYYQPDVMNSAAQKSERITISQIMEASLDKNNLMNSAKLLQRELPKRVAKIIVAFHALPFIAASNPSLLRCQEIYTAGYHHLKSIPPVVDEATEIEFSQNLKDMMDYHKEIISLLARGFREAGKYIKDKKAIKHFLDDLIKSRLGIRLLGEHHIRIPLDYNKYCGIVELNFSPEQLIERKAKDTKNQCDNKYGSSPDVIIDGHINATFPHISPPLDYILNEILKNSMRAVMELGDREIGSHLPPIRITIVNNDLDFIIRISDEGLGIKYDSVKHVFDYGFTSLDQTSHESSTFDLITENRSAGIMFGYGFGLPVCRAFVEYLGGQLSLQSMEGTGTDVYIRLPHINKAQNGKEIFL